MTGDDIAEKLASALLIELMEYAEDLPGRFVDIPKNALPDALVCSSLVENLPPERIPQLITLLKWAVIDVVSTTLGMIQGSTVIADFYGSFRLTYDNLDIGKDIGDHFLRQTKNSSADD